jgi:hypothetical protein
MHKRPYLELYRGHLFTIPDATCYECDVCDFIEFDESIVEMIGDMVFGISAITRIDDKNRFPKSSATDDDIPAKTRHPLL